MVNNSNQLLIVDGGIPPNFKLDVKTFVYNVLLLRCTHFLHFRNYLIYFYIYWFFFLNKLIISINSIPFNFHAFKADVNQLF